MHLLLDTQILVWMITGDTRLRPAWQDAMASLGAMLHVSAVVACEYTELQLRKRIPVNEGLAELVERFELSVAPFPADGWRKLRGLPQIHRDPVDRMLVAHALASEMALVTADANIRRYPVTCI